MKVSRGGKRVATTRGGQHGVRELRELSQKELAKIERMLETWRLCIVHYRDLQALAQRRPRNDRLAAKVNQSRAQFLRMQRELLKIASQGRGFGTLRTLYEQNHNAGLKFFVQWLDQLMKGWTRDHAFVEIPANSEYLLAILKKEFGISRADLETILRSERVAKARWERYAHGAALEAAAMVMRESWRTVQRRIKSVPSSTRFWTRGIALTRPLGPVTKVIAPDI